MKHRNIFSELDDAILFYPQDIQCQNYRLVVDFTALNDQRLLIEDQAESIDFTDDDRMLFEGLLSLIDDIFEQRIPNPGGPQ